MQVTSVHYLKKLLEFHITATSCPLKYERENFSILSPVMIFTGNFGESRLHVVAFEGHHEITVLLEVPTINLISVLDIA